MGSGALAALLVASLANEIARRWCFLPLLRKAAGGFHGGPQCPHRPPPIHALGLMLVGLWTGGHLAVYPRTLGLSPLRKMCAGLIGQSSFAGWAL